MEYVEQGCKYVKEANNKAGLNKFLVYGIVSNYMIHVERMMASKLFTVLLTVNQIGLQLRTLELE